MFHSPTPPSPDRVPGASYRHGPAALLWEHIVPFLDKHLQK
jgi:hypothetical protein